MRISVSALVVGVWMIASGPVHAQSCSPVPGGSSAADINACLAGGNNIVTLTDGAVYMIDQTLNITVAGTTLTGQGSANRPILRAANGLAAPILSVSNVSGFRLRYLKLDGNIDGRTNSDLCNAPDHPYLGNVSITGNGSGFTIEQIESSNAMCHSGFGVEGSNFTVTASTFANNGDSADQVSGKWADGLTVTNCDQGTISGNTITDATDVGLIVGGGQGCIVEGNTITNAAKHTFAGLMVGWFPTGWGDHTGSVFQNNTISSSYNQMAYGIMVGHEPWWNSSGLDGWVPNAGSVTNNTVSGAVVNLAVDGIGGGNVSGNSLSGHQGNFGFGCSISEAYTAHYFQPATIDGGWTPVWFSGGQCGAWSLSTPQPDNTGAIVHKGNGDFPEQLYPTRYLNPQPPGGSVWSDSGQYQLVYQANDGNLVLYDSTGNVVFNFQAPIHSAGRAIMQDDGNFVIYDSNGAPVCQTHTHDHPGAYMVVRSDGNVTIYDLSGTVLYERQVCS